MRNFLKNVLSTIVGVVLSIIVVILLFIGIISITISSFDNEKESKIYPNSILKIDLTSPIVERASNNPFENLSFNNMDPKTTIKKNIRRRSPIVNEDIKFYKGIPLPTWIELSLIDVCNRTCSFCPKSDPKVAPDTFQKMSRNIIDKIHDQLLEIHFKGTISLCGYGEPLLHKDIGYIVQKLSQWPVVSCNLSLTVPKTSILRATRRSLSGK